MSIRNLLAALRPAARPAAEPTSPIAAKPPARLEKVVGGKVQMQDFHFTM